MTKINKNFWIRNPFWTSICASIVASLIIGILSFYFNSIFSIKPELKEIQKSITSSNDNFKKINKNLEFIVSHIKQRPVDGIPCKVGASANLKGNMASVYVNNPFGLKQQKCIEITYRKGLTNISTTVIIDVIDNAISNSKADIFLGTEFLEKDMGISKAEQKKTGIFNMSYKIPDEK